MAEMANSIGVVGLAEVVRVERAKNAGVSVVFTAQAIANDKKLRFVGVVEVGGVEYVIASDTGVTKTFADVDDLVKALASVAATPSGDYVVRVATGLLLAQKPPSNIVAANAARVRALGARAARLAAVVTKLDAQLALMAGWENGNALQAAKLESVRAQKSVLIAESAAVAALITRLQT